MVQPAKPHIILIGGPGSELGRAILDRLDGIASAIVTTVRPTDATVPCPLPGNVQVRHLDVCDWGGVEGFFDDVFATCSASDILINNAGINADRFVPLMRQSDWDTVVQTTLTGLFYCCKCYLRKMIPHRRGQIINIASIKGLTGGAGQANYAASKGGVIALTKSLAREMAPFNITANAVCPGFIPSGLNRGSPHKIKAARSESLMPIGSNLHDVAEFVAFLCEGRLHSVTGQVFAVDSRI